ncbi:MAG: hypothetical protein K2N58_08280 [Treponemataceae bacterium]|nr:hypothetical protein [Treponemataceae bacterium]
MNGDSSSVFCDAFATMLCAFLCGLCACAIFSCASIEKKLSDLAAPYAIFDSQITERDEAGIEFTFSNLGERTIVRVKFFARVQESGDSEDDFSDDSMEKEFVFDAEFDPGDSERIFIPLSEFEFDGGIENYFVESLFASEIIFSDGEIWNDKDGKSAL